MKPIRTTLIVIITVAAVLAARRWLIEPIYIASDSMAPTLSKGHHLFLDKVTYRFRQPSRGEIIAFRSPVGEDHESVKRVIAVAGDTIELKSKKVYLNGEPQLETYAYYARAAENLQGDNLPPVTVPDGALFVLGDNRDNSNDSASWKDPATGAPPLFLPLPAVTGKVRGSY
ncbi:MAG: signal peptidase I [Elusimicrobia bacterium GWA2_61_42]|nr:MAG: signal peptidase I [Elusimicrobia bacterium GWA2_61_42]OGR75875.1 MAG: signal peptidase I [Elusimicrobia bacterium GWC2_61_25]